MEARPPPAASLRLASAWAANSPRSRLIIRAAFSAAHPRFALQVPLDKAQLRHSYASDGFASMFAGALRLTRTSASTDVTVAPQEGGCRASLLPLESILSNSPPHLVRHKIGASWRHSLIVVHTDAARHSRVARPSPMHTSSSALGRTGTSPLPASCVSSTQRTQCTVHLQRTQRTIPLLVVRYAPFAAVRRISCLVGEPPLPIVRLPRTFSTTERWSTSQTAWIGHRMIVFRDVARGGL